MKPFVAGALLFAAALSFSILTPTTSSARQASPESAHTNVIVSADNRLPGKESASRMTHAANHDEALRSDILRDEDLQAIKDAKARGVTVFDDAFYKGISTKEYSRSRFLAWQPI